MPNTLYWNSVTGQWNAASLSGTLPVVGDSVIADGRSQRSMVTSLDRSTDVYATERVVNGDFATDTVWTKGTGWTIAGGLGVAAAGTASDLSQTGILVIGRSYYVTFTVSGRTAGTIAARCGTTSGATQSTNATFSENIVCATDTGLHFAKSSTFDGDIDNVSVVESVGLDLAKFETTASYRGDIGTPDLPLRFTADLFIHRGSGKLYYKPTGLAALVKVDRLIIDTPNLAHEITLGHNDVVRTTEIVLLRGKARYIGNGGTDRIFLGYSSNQIVDAYLHIAPDSRSQDIFVYGGTLIDDGLDTVATNVMYVAGGYAALNGQRSTYVQMGGHADYGVLLGTPPGLTTAYLLGGSMDATMGSPGKTITTAYISPTFSLIEDSKLTITNRVNLWE